MFTFSINEIRFNVSVIEEEEEGGEGGGGGGSDGINVSISTISPILFRVLVFIDSLLELYYIEKRKK